MCDFYELNKLIRLQIYIYFVISSSFFCFLQNLLRLNPDLPQHLIAQMHQKYLVRSDLSIRWAP